MGIPEKNAKILFCYDNPPGTKEISGAQDSIGIAMPGLTYCFYNNEYWPTSFETITDEESLDFVENLFYLIPLGPRHDGYAVLKNTNITSEGAKRLADATEGVWETIKAKNAREFGRQFKASFDAQIEMFPNMLTPVAAKLIDEYRDHASGWKLSGAGGGGYLILVSEEPVENGVRVSVRGRNGS